MPQPSYLESKAMQRSVVHGHAIVAIDGFPCAAHDLNMRDSVADWLTASYRTAQDRKISQRSSDLNYDPVGPRFREEAVEGETQNAGQGSNDCINCKSCNASPESGDDP